jgi:hypothetical protein
MDLHEELAMQHLTRSRKVFVVHQYPIEIEGVSGNWSLPDFVALDFERKAVYVVEVTTAQSPGGLLKKVRDREEQWFAKLRDMLRRGGVVDDAWTKFEVVLYVRRDVAEKFRAQLGNPKDVTIYAFEEIGLYWDWDWPVFNARKQADETHNRL